MNHYVYQITNQSNGKIYVGKRSCKCSIEDDAYMGSGIHIRRAIKKYGIENFDKDIIILCESDKEAYEIESVIVNVDFIKRTDTYNICSGGDGVGVGEGHPMFGKNHSEETIAKMSDSNTGKTPSPETRAKLSASQIGDKNTMFGKNHSPEAIAKISNAMKGKQTGDKNPMFGRTGDKNHLFGKTLSPEHRAKISAAKTGEGNAMFGKPKSSEAIAKMIATKRANARAKLILKEF